VLVGFVSTETTTTATSSTAKIPLLLLPYNIVMLFVLLCAKIWDSTSVTSHMIDISDFEETDADLVNERYYGYQAILNGISRIYLVDGVLSGFMILVAIWLNSRILALAVIGGTFFASLISWIVFDLPNPYINEGYTGYNPGLTIVALFYYLVPSWKLAAGVAPFLLFLTMILSGAINVVLTVLYVYL
jgi:urea transporter